MKNVNISKVKEKSSSILHTINEFVFNTMNLFKKDESKMTKEEKVEKQHVMTFFYGMVAGVIVYHFLIGVLLIAVVMGLYFYSVKKTKSLMAEENSLEDNSKK
jgi:hypothetical protein